MNYSARKAFSFAFSDSFWAPRASSLLFFSCPLRTYLGKAKNDRFSFAASQNKGGRGEGLRAAVRRFTGDSAIPARISDPGYQYIPGIRIPDF
eukprot:107376-Amorphochlora_amoeboformis.AAC.1